VGVNFRCGVVRGHAIGNHRKSWLFHNIAFYIKTHCLKAKEEVQCYNLLSVGSYSDLSFGCKVSNFFQNLQEFSNIFESKPTPLIFPNCRR
jgi:hypothetical protein